MKIAKNYHEYYCKSEFKNMREAMETEWKSFHYPPETCSPYLILKTCCLIRNNYENSMNIKESLEFLFDYKKSFKNTELNYAHKMLTDEEQSIKVDKIFDIIVNISRLNEIKGLEEYLKNYRNELSQMDDGFDLKEDIFKWLMKLIFVIIALNGQGIGVSSFENYQQFLRGKEELLDMKGKLKESEISKTLDQIEFEYLSKIDEINDSFTHVEGSGLYKIHKYFNENIKSK